MKKIITALALACLTNLALASFPTNKALNQSLLEGSIKCKTNEFAYNGYYWYADYGCLYGKKTNPLGDTDTHLFPITNKYIPTATPQNAGELMSARVDKLSNVEIKANFDVFIRVTDKKYLVYRTGIDTPYYIANNHVDKIYHFNRAKNY